MTIHFNDRMSLMRLYITIFLFSLLQLFWGCGETSGRQSFELQIIGKLPEKWKFYAVDAAENFLLEHSDKYSHSFLETQYRSIQTVWEEYLCSAESDSHNLLVKKILTLQKEKTQQSKNYENQVKGFLKNFNKNSTPNVKKDSIDNMEEKYELAMQLLDRDKYDKYWFATRTLSSKDDEFLINKIGVLNLYFSKLPPLEIYFYYDPGDYGWTPFLSMIDFTEHYVQKHLK